MATYGYTLSSEEQAPLDLVRYAVRAEELGFEFASISDHYHPWIARQGQSGFVWGTLGALSQATKKLGIGTGVTCPLIRIHPAIIAQASATAATLFQGRFFLGVGAGENLNEHILGDRWPRAAERLERLEEAIDIIRQLWTGELVSHRGSYYQVDEAQIFTKPEVPPLMNVAASGEVSATLAATAGDGLVGVSPDSSLIDTFQQQGGKEKPRYGQVTVCYAADEKAARTTVREWWPNAGLAGNLSWETKTPQLFADACQTLSTAQIVEDIPCGPDVDAHLSAAQKFIDAGYSHVFFHQIGPDQDAFLDFYDQQLRDKLPTG